MAKTKKEAPIVEDTGVLEVEGVVTPEVEEVVVTTGTTEEPKEAEKVLYFGTERVLRTQNRIVNGRLYTEAETIKGETYLLTSKEFETQTHYV